MYRLAKRRVAAVTAAALSLGACAQNPMPGMQGHGPLNLDGRPEFIAEMTGVVPSLSFAPNSLPHVNALAIERNPKIRKAIGNWYTKASMVKAVCAKESSISTKGIRLVLADGGEHDAKCKQAVGEAMAAQALVLETVNTLASEVTIAYLKVVQARAVLTEIERNYGDHRAFRTVVDKAVKAGITDSGAQTLADERIKARETDRVRFQQQLVTAQAKLTELVQAEVNPVEVPDFSAATPASKDQANGSAQLNHPTLLPFDAALLSAAAEREVAVAATLPHLAFNLSMPTAVSWQEVTPSRASAAASVVDFDWTLWDDGKAAAHIDASEGKAETTLYDREITIRHIAYQVDEAFAALAAARDIARFKGEEAKLAKTNLDNSRRKFELPPQGATSEPNTVLQQMDRLLGVQIDRVKAGWDERAAEVALLASEGTLADVIGAARLLPLVETLRGDVSRLNTEMAKARGEAPATPAKPLPTPGNELPWTQAVAAPLTQASVRPSWVRIVDARSVPASVSGMPGLGRPTAGNGVVRYGAVLPAAQPIGYTTYVQQQPTWQPAVVPPAPTQAQAVVRAPASEVNALQAQMTQIEAKLSSMQNSIDRMAPVAGR